MSSDRLTGVRSLRICVRESLRMSSLKPVRRSTEVTMFLTMPAPFSDRFSTSARSCALPAIMNM
jgi:hypothetical protein